MRLSVFDKRKWLLFWKDLTLVEGQIFHHSRHSQGETYRLARPKIVVTRRWVECDGACLAATYPRSARFNGLLILE